MTATEQVHAEHAVRGDVSRRKSSADGSVNSKCLPLGGPLLIVAACLRAEEARQALLFAFVAAIVVVVAVESARLQVSWNEPHSRPL